MVWGDLLNFITDDFAKGPRILTMVMTFVLTPWSHYNTITEPRAHFFFSLLEGLSIDFPSHTIVSMIDIYQDIATCDKLIFPSAITRILTHMHVLIPFAPLFFMWRSATQLASKAKQSHEESTPAQQEEVDIRLLRMLPMPFDPLLRLLHLFLLE